MYGLYITRNHRNNDSVISSPQGYPGFHVYFVDKHTIVRPGENKQEKHSKQHTQALNDNAEINP